MRLCKADMREIVLRWSLESSLDEFVEESENKVLACNFTSEFMFTEWY